MFCSVLLPSEYVPSQMWLLFKPHITFKKAMFLGRRNISLHFLRYLKEKKKKKKISGFQEQMLFFGFRAIIFVIATFKKEQISTWNNNSKNMIDTALCKTFPNCKKSSSLYPWHMLSGLRVELEDLSCKHLGQCKALTTSLPIHWHFS